MVSAAKAIHTEVLIAHGGKRGMRDQALLESAVAAPQATMSGKPILSDPVDIAAAYLFYLCRNHAFVDGNKRTALAACLVFLESNDLLPHDALPVADWESLIVDIAAGRVDRVEATARLRKLLRELRKSKARE